jgi:hypothetical protein
MGHSSRHVRAAGGAALPALAFSDNFNRADASFLGPNWLQCPWVIPAGGGVTTSALGNIVTNRCRIAGIGSNNPAQCTGMAFMPAPTYFNLYNQKKTFVQVTFISQTANQVCGLGLRFNPQLLGSIGTNCAEFYYLDNSGNVRRVLGGSNTVLGASAVTFAGGNIIKFTADDIGTAVNLEVFQNGVSLFTFSDANAGRVTVGSPALIFQINAGVNVGATNFVIDDFSCGIF